MEVGNFLDYKNHYLAVVAVNEEKNEAYCLCHENQKMAKIPLDAEVKMVKEKGCQSIVKAIYDDMDHAKFYGRYSK